MRLTLGKPSDKFKHLFERVGNRCWNSPPVPWAVALARETSELSVAGGVLLP